MYDEDEFLPPMTLEEESRTPTRTVQPRQIAPSPEIEITHFDLTAYDYLQSFVVTFTIMIFFTTFIGLTTRVSGHSMDPTLYDNELLFVWSLGYSPEAGDIVIINKPTLDYLNGQSIVKRVIATEGQLVTINYDENSVLVDGIPISEPYILEPMKPYTGSADNITETLVPEGSLYVLGDNRNNSADSRYEPIGTIDTGYVLGKVIFSFWPLSTMRTIS